MHSRALRETLIWFFQQSGHAVLGLPYALASLSFCQSFNLDLLKASATLTLAELWLSLGSNHAKRALSLIHGALPMILGHGGLDLCARAYIAEAKCYLSDPSFSGIVCPVFHEYTFSIGNITYLSFFEYHECWIIFMLSLLDIGLQPHAQFCYQSAIWFFLDKYFWPLALFENLERKWVIKRWFLPFSLWPYTC